MAAPTDSSWIPPPLPEVLLDRCCYIANLVNATTAEGTTSTGLRIQVTFRAAPPPRLSHLCVHCPGLDFPKAVPKVITTDADLVLLCVPVYPDTIGHGRHWDYFVYSFRARRLDLIPNPIPNPWSLIDSAIALLSRQDKDGGAWYAVAALDCHPPTYNGRVVVRCDFELHLYKSCNSSERWISKVMSLNDLGRDRLIPLPAVNERLYHEADKTIAIGGEGGTVAWVDLWRGILFCDVLRDCPVLQVVPLPVPARGNWNRLMDLEPIYFRDVTVSQNRDSVKYIEMESWSPIDQLNASCSYAEWVRDGSSRLRVNRRDGWKATTWSLKMPVDFDSQLWEENCWHRHSEIDVKDVTLPLDATGSCPSDLLAMLCSIKATQMFKELEMSYPIISMDDDIVYFLSTIKSSEHVDEFQVVFAIDVSKGVLRGLVDLDGRKSFIFTSNIFCSDICRHLTKVTGTVEASSRTEKQHNLEHGIKPTKQEQGDPAEDEI